MNENDIIAEFVKEKYPELLGTYDFAWFRLRKAALKMQSDIAEGLKEIDFDSAKKEVEKVNKIWKEKFYLFQRTDQHQDGFRANIILCDEKEHEKKHRFFKKVLNEKKRR